jgi:hypothetical protein
VDAGAADGKGNHLSLMGQDIERSAAASDEDLGGAIVAALERSTAAPTR